MRVWSFTPRNWEGLPWWLNPWREVRRYRQANGSLLRETGQLAHDLELCGTAHARVRRELEDTRVKLRNALLGNLHTATPSQKPEFVLIGIDRGNGQGKRLIAGRDLPGAELSMTSMDDPPPRWKVNATLARPLFIDEPDYATALDRMRTIWMNWDREQPTTTIEPPARGAIEP